MEADYSLRKMHRGDTCTEYLANIAEENTLIDISSSNCKYDH
jgi:hypothetical protein